MPRTQTPDPQKYPTPPDVETLAHEEDDADADAASDTEDDDDAEGNVDSGAPLVGSDQRLAKEFGQTQEQIASNPDPDADVDETDDVEQDDESEDDEDEDDESDLIAQRP